MNKRYLFFWIILLVFFAVVSFFIAEVYVRVAKKELVNIDILRSRREATALGGLVRFSSNPEIYYEVRPNLKLTFQKKLVVSGEGGYRISAKKRTLERKGAVRVAVLGDSTSFGWGVDFDDTYAELFTRDMERRFGRPVDLRNYSVPGYNSKQELHTFLEKVKPYKPDLLILHHDHNDSEKTDNEVKEFNPKHLLPEYGDNFLHSALVKLILREIKARQYNSSLVFEKSEHKFLNKYIVSGPFYDAHLVALEELANHTKNLNIPTVVIIFNAFVEFDKNFPARPTEEYTVLHDRLKGYLDDMDYYVLDLYPGYQLKMREEGWFDLSEMWVSKSPVDGHPNPEGHSLIAGILKDYMVGEPALKDVFEHRE